MMKKATDYLFIFLLVPFFMLMAFVAVTEWLISHLVLKVVYKGDENARLKANWR